MPNFWRQAGVGFWGTLANWFNTKVDTVTCAGNIRGSIVGTTLSLVGESASQLAQSRWIILGTDLDNGNDRGWYPFTGVKLDADFDYSSATTKLKDRYIPDTTFSDVTVGTKAYEWNGLSLVARGQVALATPAMKDDGTSFWSFTVPRNYIWARFTGTVYDHGPDEWEYDFVEVEYKPSSGGDSYSNWEDKLDGITGSLCINSIEGPNKYATAYWGNGISQTTVPDGFDIVSAGIGKPVVQLFRTHGVRGNDLVRWVFSFANTVDGTCT